jgi:hypothetical protein
MSPAKKCAAKCEPPPVVLPPEVTALVPVEAELLSLSRAPQAVIEEAMVAAKAIKAIIDAKPKPFKIRGETYLQFEDWQTVARFYGVTVRVVETKGTRIGDAVGFMARAEALLVANGRVISAADAMCLNDEPKWKSRPKYGEDDRGKWKRIGEEAVPLFQLRSMAQTRACAKALRNVLAWVVVLAGYKPTPAEELDTDHDQRSEFGACGRCGTDMYFKDEGKSGICRTCKEKGIEIVNDPNFIKESLAHVAAVKAGKVTVRPPNGAGQ